MTSCSRNSTSGQVAFFSTETGVSPVLTLQLQDLSDQHLGVHQVGKRVHGLVHQLDAEDGEELLPDDLPLLVAGTRPPGRLPARGGGRPGRVGPVSPGRVGPVLPLLLLPVVVDSATLEVGRLAVGGRVDRVGAVSGVARRVGSHVAPGAVMLVLESRRRPPRGRAVRAAAARGAVLLSGAVAVRAAPVHRPVLVVAHAPRGLRRLTVYRAQTGVQLLLGTAPPPRAVVRRRVLGGLLLPGRGGPLAGRLPLSGPRVIFLAMSSSSERLCPGSGLERAEDGGGCLAFSRSSSATRRLDCLARSGWSRYMSLDTMMPSDS
ncbi:hypothetical protein EYF80_032463 [Liparis tanakae]|uniref:Uncharacterized protein n=1 Tax=Liparis tanakae TaxID=230148 RepID=A0A4Z2GUT6_9TELE|nr:hypothetical protein EYF80_032463 [Liparis tanakae]